MQPRQVALESVSFVLTHIHEGVEAEWNEYYENDHFYAGGVLAPGVLSGRRWYAPARLRTARFASPECPFPDPGAGQAAATYFLTAPRGSEEFLEWIPDQVEALSAQGRMFRKRDVVNVSVYLYDAITGNPLPRMAPHVTQEHPWAAMFATLARGHVIDSPEPDLPLGSVTLRFAWRPANLLAEHATQPSLEGDAPTWLLLTFLKSPPPEDSIETARLAGSVAAVSGLDPVWAGGFLPVTAGDDSFLEDFS